MIKPTKPIKPETETAAPTISEPATSRTRRWDSVETPNCSAVSSPRARTLSPRAEINAQLKPDPKENRQPWRHIQAGRRKIPHQPDEDATSLEHVREGGQKDNGRGSKRIEHNAGE